MVLRSRMRYSKSVFIALDQLLNALFGGYPDETLSSRAYRMDVGGGPHWPRKFIDSVALIFRDKDHCREAFFSECYGRQLPPIARRYWRGKDGRRSL